MDIIEVIQEIVMTHTLCSKESDDCEFCTHGKYCMEVFGKKFPTTEIEELASQCKAFNEFARANKKGN